MHDEAISALQEATSNKIAVVAVCGEINSGKSFLLNQFVRIKNTFELNKQPEFAETQGLWLYTEPITIEKEGDILDIFLMDCEGLTLATDINQIRLLSLILSLSSLVLFNSREMTDNHFDCLSMVDQIALIG